VAVAIGGFVVLPASIAYYMYTELQQKNLAFVDKVDSFSTLSKVDEIPKELREYFPEPYSNNFYRKELSSFEDD
jgi:hypothetical protein